MKTGDERGNCVLLSASVETFWNI